MARHYKTAPTMRPAGICQCGCGLLVVFLPDLASPRADGSLRYRSCLLSSWDGALFFNPKHHRLHRRDNRRPSALTPPFFDDPLFSPL